MRRMFLPEAAEFLGIHPHTLQERAKSGVVKAYKPGRAWVFFKHELVEYLQSLTQCPSISVVIRGGRISSSKDGELEYLLKQRTEKPRSARTMNLKLVSGTKQNQEQR